MIDIGGGSVEIITAYGGHVEELASLPLGMFSFDLAVQKVDISKEATRELRTALLRANVKI